MPLSKIVVFVVVFLFLFLFQIINVYWKTQNKYGRYNIGGGFSVSFVLIVWSTFSNFFFVLQKLGLRLLQKTTNKVRQFY